MVFTSPGVNALINLIDHSSSDKEIVQWCGNGDHACYWY